MPLWFVSTVDSQSVDEQVTAGMSFSWAEAAKAWKANAVDWQPAQKILEDPKPEAIRCDCEKDMFGAQ